MSPVRSTVSGNGCDHVAWPAGRCLEPATIKIVTVGYPTWRTCEDHAGVRIGIMLRGAEGADHLIVRRADR